MTLARFRPWLTGAGILLLVGACSSGASPTGTPAGGGTGGNGSASQVPGGGSGGSQAPAGTGGDLTSVDACSLLTAAEINTALGITVKAGVPQTTDTQVECEWDSQDGASGVSVTVARYDDAVWQTLSKAQNAKPVSGLGDAAFTGVPHAGDVAVRTGAYEMDLGIVDFTADTAKVDAADASLAALVLSRL